jgi:hypothetical protein
MRIWAKSQGPFFPKSEQWPYIYTELDNSELAQSLIDEHKARARTPHEYWYEDYSDEICIRVFSGGRWRLLINLQFEGNKL